MNKNFFLVIFATISMMASSAQDFKTSNSMQRFISRSKCKNYALCCAPVIGTCAGCHVASIVCQSLPACVTTQQSVASLCVCASAGAAACAYATRSMPSRINIDEKNSMVLRHELMESHKNIAKSFCLGYCRGVSMICCCVALDTIMERR